MRMVFWTSFLFVFYVYIGYPMLLVDRVLDYEPNQYIRGLKNVSANEPFFQGHFPQYPVMPGVLTLLSAISF